MPLAVESRLGPYKVKSLIGAGAMGEVYRARDSRLKRDVAIKIISSATSGPACRHRFEHEARAASALNHPNILTIHDIGHEDDISYIVTELVDGESLRKLLNQGRLSLRKALDIAVQIAAGLAAAHDAGIVHRDLKPENIMITRDGRVKILDFGLAKEIGGEAFSDAGRTFGNNDTSPGLLIGTTAYMSPEQAKGGRVNFYSDQFSFGLILYEIVTGEQAFRRETPLQTLSAILTEDPPELDRGSVPLRWLVKRCLHREPDHRYRSTFDLLQELQNIRDRLTEPTDAPVAPAEVPRARRRLNPWPFAAAAALIAGLSAGYWVARSGSTAASGAGEARFLPFAAEAALEVAPEWSPNGRTIAYAAEIDGVFQIVTRSLGSAAITKLTNHAEDCLFPFWSPDGVRVYYTAGYPGAQSLWSVGATGGTPELVAENVARAAIAPDANTLAVIRPEPAGGLFTLWSGSLNARKFQRRLEKTFLAPSFIRFAPGGTLGVWLSLTDGRSEFSVLHGKSLTFHTPRALEFCWLPDSRQIVFSSGSGLSMRSHLLQAGISSGAIDRITNGAGSELSPSVAANGRTIAFTSGNLDYDLVEVRLDGSVKAVISTPVSEVAPTLAADQLAFATDRTGEPEIWLRTPNAEWDRPIVTAGSFGEDKTFFLFDTVFAPDGRRIAFRRAGGDDEAIWISTTAGDPPVRLAREPGDAFQRGPTWSPDGNQIAYSSVRKGRYALIRARVGGFQPPAVVAQDTGTDPRWSPAGNWIATLGPGSGITLLSPDGKLRKTTGTGVWLLHGWAKDGRTLIGVRRSHHRKLEVVSLDIVTGVESVTGEIGPYKAAFTYADALGAPPLRGFSLSPDGRSFLTSMIGASGDIWLMEREH